MLLIRLGIIFILHLNLNRKRLLVRECQHELLSHLKRKHILFLPVLMMLPFVEVNEDEYDLGQNDNL